MKRVSLYLPDDLYDELVRGSKMRGLSLAAFIRYILFRWNKVWFENPNGEL